MWSKLQQVSILTCSHNCFTSPNSTRWGNSEAHLGKGCGIVLCAGLVCRTLTPLLSSMLRAVSQFVKMSHNMHCATLDFDFLSQKVIFTLIPFAVSRRLRSRRHHGVNASPLLYHPSSLSWKVFPHLLRRRSRQKHLVLDPVR